MIKTLVLLLFTFASSSVHALEPLKDSSDAYIQLKAERNLAEWDQNKDSIVKEEEIPKHWKKKKGLDTNQDGALDLSELKKSPLPYVNSAGKQLKNVLFKKTATGDVYLDFYFPVDDTRSDKPVVLYTHGGGWAVGDKHGAGRGSFDAVHRQLLEEGFCVVSVDYRLVKKGGKTAMRDCVIDSKDALRFISAHHEQLGVDPMKCYTFGDSAGGHLAQMILLSPPETLTGDPELAKFSYKTVAGVSWYGPCDFQDPQLFNHNDRPNFRDRFGRRIMGGGAPTEEKEQRYREISPITYLTEKSPPLLMIQGDKDTTIPVKQVYRMQEALKTIKAPVEILIVKNSGHNWRSVDAPIEPTRHEIIERTVQFLIDHKR